MATKKPAAAPKEAAPPKEKEEAAPQEAAAAPKKGKGLLIGIVSGVVLLVAAGGTAWYFMTRPSAAATAEADATATPESEEPVVEKKAPKKPKAEGKHPPVFVMLEPFTVNLQDENESHYLQVAVVLGAADNVAVDSIKLHMPVIRNGILLLLSSKRSAEIATLDGKQQLAAAIADEARKPLEAAGVEEGVEAVYFSSFVIQ